MDRKKVVERTDKGFQDDAVKAGAAAARAAFANLPEELDREAVVKAQRAKRLEEAAKKKATEQAEMERVAKENAEAEVAEQLAAAKAEKLKAQQGEAGALEKASAEEQARIAAEKLALEEAAAKVKAEEEAKQIEKQKQEALAEAEVKEMARLESIRATDSEKNQINVESEDLLHKLTATGESIIAKTSRFDEVQKLISSTAATQQASAAASAASEQMPKQTGGLVKIASLGSSAVSNAVSYIGSKIWTGSKQQTAKTIKADSTYAQAVADHFQLDIEVGLLNIQQTVSTAKVAFKKATMQYLQAKIDALTGKTEMDKGAEEAFVVAQQAFEITKATIQESYKEVCQKAYRASATRDILTEVTAEFAAARTKEEEAQTAKIQANEVYSGSSIRKPLDMASASRAASAAATALEEANKALKIAQTSFENLQMVDKAKTTAFEAAKQFAALNSDFGLVYNAEEIEVPLTPPSASGNHTPTASEEEPTEAAAAASAGQPSENAGDTPTDSDFVHVLPAQSELVDVSGASSAAAADTLVDSTQQ